MTGEALQISPANDPRGSPAKEQQAAGVGIILQIMMLVLSFVLGHVLRRHKFYYLPEASASLLIGLIVGALANISNTETNIRAWFNFDEEFFFLFLLPPIIFQSGFSLSPKPFFSNFGAIVTFAIFGTFLASMVTGILVYLGGVMFLMYRLPFVECLMFGALISATDVSGVHLHGFFEWLSSPVSSMHYFLGRGSSSPPATSVQTTSAPAAIPITSPAASQHTAVPHASALFPGIPSRPPHVSFRVSPTINHQISRGIRAPAPHLQPFRPSTSLASTSLPSSVLPTLPSNARPTSIPLLQRPLLSPLATCNTSLYNRAPGPETSGVVPSVPNPSLSAMDLLMDFVDNRSGASQILPSGLPSVSEFSSSSVPIVRPESNMQSSQANPGPMSEPVDIVCLSDDD